MNDKNLGQYKTLPSSLKTEIEAKPYAITKIQLSQYLQISVGFIDKLIAEEGLPHFKLGRAIRFNVDEITAFLDRRKRP